MVRCYFRQLPNRVSCFYAHHRYKISNNQLLNQNFLSHMVSEHIQQYHKFQSHTRGVGVCSDVFLIEIGKEILTASDSLEEAAARSIIEQFILQKFGELLRTHPCFPSSSTISLSLNSSRVLFTCRSVFIHSSLRSFSSKAVAEANADEVLDCHLLRSKYSDWKEVQSYLW